MADMRNEVAEGTGQEGIEIIRVLRVIEYIGDRKWIEGTLKKSIQGTLYLHDSPNLRCIRTAQVGNIAEVLDDGEVKTLKTYLDSRI